VVLFLFLFLFCILPVEIFFIFNLHNSIYKQQRKELVRFTKTEEGFGVPLNILECDIVPRFVTPHGIWPQHDLRVRFSYLEGKESHQGSGEPASWALVKQRCSLSIVGLCQV